MKISRSQKRQYFNQSPQGKRIQELHFLHPEKVEYRAKIREMGDKEHEEFTSAIQDRIYEERLAPREAELSKILEDNNVSKSKINEYLEVWSDTVMWPKPNNHIEAKKQLKSLNKEYNING